MNGPETALTEAAPSSPSKPLTLEEAVVAADSALAGIKSPGQTVEQVRQEALANLTIALERGGNDGLVAKGTGAQRKLESALTRDTHESRWNG